jgi:hypothetical protein
MYVSGTNRIATQIIRFRWPIASAKNPLFDCLARLTSGICETPVGTFSPW